MMPNFRKIPQSAFGTKPVVVIRDIDAVVHNYHLFKEKANQTDSDCGVVLKADVHGLKMKDVAPALYEQGARHFFIEELFEGIELRKMLPHPDAHIFAMAGLLQSEERYFHELNITPCLNCIEQIIRWNTHCATHGNRSAVIHLDTHMNRLGLLDNEVNTLSAGFSTLTSNLDIEFYMSHFSDIKGSDHTQCYTQLDILNRYLKILPKKPVSFACTDSVILLDNDTFNLDMIRPGIGLVGGAPNAAHPIDKDARVTIEIYAKISQIKMIPKGSQVGYAGAFTTKRDTKMALVHIGYKDGYLRALSELDNDSKGVYMGIGSYKTPVIGKISLGMTTVDVTDVPEDILNKYGYVEVVGHNVDLKELADKAGCYEILAALGRPNPKIADYTLDQFNKQHG